MLSSPCSCPFSCAACCMLGVGSRRHLRGNVSVVRVRLFNYRDTGVRAVAATKQPRARGPINYLTNLSVVYIPRRFANLSSPCAVGYSCDLVIETFPGDVRYPQNNWGLPNTSSKRLLYKLFKLRGFIPAFQCKWDERPDQNPDLDC